MSIESSPSSFNREDQRSTKKKIGQKYRHIEELRSLGIIIENKNKREIHDEEEELTDVLRIIKHSLYRAYKTAYSQDHEHDNDDDDDSYSSR